MQGLHHIRLTQQRRGMMKLLAGEYRCRHPFRRTHRIVDRLCGNYHLPQLYLSGRFSRPRFSFQNNDPPRLVISYGCFRKKMYQTFAQGLLLYV